MSTHVVITRHELTVHRANDRGERPGIFGEAIDLAEDKALDHQGKAFGLERKQRVVFRLWRLKLWKREQDESFRRRIFIAYQKEFLGKRAPCVHNTVAGYDDYNECVDCGEPLVWVSRAAAQEMNLFLTQCVEET